VSIDNFSEGMLASLIIDAKVSDRKRQHRNIHRYFDEKCQRLINAIGVESYIAPHRHRLDPNAR
jgi:cupin fold WbuC family metalloprotein